MFEITKLNEKAVIPKRATEGSAGYDLCACIDTEITINPGEVVLVPTGIAVKLPQNTAGMIYARSGLAIKHGICLANSVGVVDWDYRGEVKVGLVNMGKKAYIINPFDRIAQLVLSPVICPEISVVDSLDETQRGQGGFGSTGKAK